MAAPPWFILDSGSGAPAGNMALDEALLESVARLGQPVLRFYGWNEPAASFGYAQRLIEVSSWTSLRPLIRRPTGGGLVPHDADWTYSLVFPPGHEWHRLRAQESYRAVHEWIGRAFAALGVDNQLAPAEQKPAPGRCFVGAEKFDLLSITGVKLAGAAQRRNRLGLLIQGSIQPQSSAWQRGDWQEAMLQTASFGAPVSWTPFVPDEILTRRMRELTDEKYSQPWHNERR